MRESLRPQPPACLRAIQHSRTRTGSAAHRLRAGVCRGCSSAPGSTSVGDGIEGFVIPGLSPSLPANGLLRLGVALTLRLARVHPEENPPRPGPADPLDSAPGTRSLTRTSCAGADCRRAHRVDILARARPRLRDRVQLAAGPGGGPHRGPWRAASIHVPRCRP